MVAFNPYDPRAAFLLGMGQSMLQSGGWSTTPRTFGQALGAGLQGGRASMLDAVRMKRAQEADQIEEGLQKARQAKLERETEQAAALERLISGLPPEEQVLARADPSAFVKARAGGGGGLFEGTGLTAQAYNIYRNTAGKIRRGEPVTDQEWADYQIAYSELRKPEVRLVDGQEVTIQRNIPPLTREGTAPLTPVSVAPEGATPQTEQVGGATITRRRVEPKKYSADERKAAAFAYRMENAANTLDRMYAEGATFPALLDTLSRANLPGTRYVMSPQEQILVDAANEFARAALRRESGAAIKGEETIDQIRQYFPVPGDSPEAIEEKRRSREVVLEGMRGQSGGAYEEMFGGGGGAAGGSGSSGPEPGSPDTVQAGQGTEGVKRPRTLEEVQGYSSGTKFVWEGAIYTRD